MTKGCLYVVATPIGNLSDMSARAIDVLAKAHLIAAEDTRHSKKLLHHFGILTPCIPYHEHNERHTLNDLIQRLQSGQTVALISDAGTPLISDPGFQLVREARRVNIDVIPVPGPSAVIAALSVAGLPTDRFVFEGFLPATAAARRQRLEKLRQEPRTLVFFESPHRIVDSLADMAGILGEDREGVFVRELTKTFETVHHGNLDALQQWVATDANQQRGEIIVLIHGAGESAAGQDNDSERILTILLDAVSTKKAAELTAKITGQSKNQLYALALKLQRAADKQDEA